MATSRTVLFVLVAASGFITFALSQTPAPEGRVTSIFHDVQLLPAQADARPAAIDDKVAEGSALRTGADSRSELTFADLTITRLGANTIFSVNNAGRKVQLDSGSILLYARKNSGGAEITTKAVTVGISGTTVIFESRAENYDQLTVLEGNARLKLSNYPDQIVDVHAGELLHVKAGMKKLPAPSRVDLRRIMRNHPLIKNFSPLPSLDLIVAEMRNQNPNLPIPQSTAVVGTRPGGVGGFPQSSPIPTFSPRQPLPTPKPTASVAPTSTVKPTPKRTPTPTPRPVFSPKPSPKPTFTPKKRWPTPRKRPFTPTPTPGPVIR